MAGARRKEKQTKARAPSLPFPSLLSPLFTEAPKAVHETVRHGVVGDRRADGEHDQQAEVKRRLQLCNRLFVGLMLFCLNPWAPKREGGRKGGGEDENINIYIYILISVYI